MNNYFESNKKPHLICSCGNEIEPIQTPSGKYLAFQPKICPDCFDKISQEIDKKQKELNKEKIDLRLKNIRTIAMKRNLPKKFALEVSDYDFNVRFYRKFMENNQSYLIRGKPESGKTHFVGWLFMKCLKEYPLISEYDFYYTSLMEIDSKVKEEWKENAILESCHVPYLFFQFGDLEREKTKMGEVSAWVDELFFKIVDYRYNKRLPTIWITRLEDFQIKNMYDSATIGRIFEYSITINLQDNKYRRKRAKQNESYNL